jgi:hypothetical protein
MHNLEELSVNSASKPFRFIVGMIALVQLVLALIFISAPAQFVALLGLPAAPEWVDWIFAMFGARALGFAYGMVLVLRDPVKQRSWIRAMIIVQVVDWIATLVFLLRDVVTLGQVTTAAFFPVIFVAVLLLGYPRQQTKGNI